MGNFTSLWLICGLINLGAFTIHTKNYNPELYADDGKFATAGLFIVFSGPIGLGSKIEYIIEQKQP